MKVLLFGATGMVGQGVLRECLLDPGVEQVTSLGRRPSGTTAAKLREIVLDDFEMIDTIPGPLTGFDAAFFCVGRSAAGQTEAAYTRSTYDLTLKVAETLAALNPGMTSVYVSGAGTDSSEMGRFMWARVKGRTENALLRLPFKATYRVRPGAIQPLHGIRSSTAWYNALYRVLAPVTPWMRRLFPGVVTTTEQLGRAMIALAREGFGKPVIESADINNRLG